MTLSPIRRDTISLGSILAMSGHSSSNVLIAASDSTARSFCRWLLEMPGEDIICNSICTLHALWAAQHVHVRQ